MKAHILFSAYFSLTAFFLYVSNAQGEEFEATFYPFKDNTLYQRGDEPLSNGAGPNFFVGKTKSLGLRRGLLQFDFSNLPSGAKINSVELILNMDRSRSGEYVVSLHKVTNSWGENTSTGVKGGGLGGAAQTGDATWQHRFYPDDLWDSEGGDFNVEPTASRLVNGIDEYNWENAQMVEDVKSWVNDPETNHGWLLLGDENASFSVKRFVSSDSEDIAMIPALIIGYELVNELPTATRSVSWSDIKNLKEAEN
tara:strand:+ start:210 stop:968 length:759 start_codon:yes stop_codon:yes gene_type:complete